MNKSVDIDVLLAEDKLVMTLGGKVYEIDDVSMSVFMSATKAKGSDDEAGDILHKQLAKILKVDIKELKNVGLKAAALALKEVRRWVMDSGFEEAGPDDTIPKNP